MREGLIRQELPPVPLSAKALGEVQRRVEMLKISERGEDKIKFIVLNEFLKNGNRPLTLHELWLAVKPWSLADKELREVDDKSLYANLEKVIRHLVNDMAKGPVYIASENEHKHRKQLEKMYVLRERQAGEVATAEDEAA